LLLAFFHWSAHGPWTERFQFQANQKLTIFRELMPSNWSNFCTLGLPVFVTDDYKFQSIWWKSFWVSFAICRASSSNELISIFFFICIPAAKELTDTSFEAIEKKKVLGDNFVVRQTFFFSIFGSSFPKNLHLQVWNLSKTEKNLVLFWISNTLILLVQESWPLDNLF